MSEQVEFLKNVRERFVVVQNKATERIGTLNQDAKKALEGLVEKGRTTQHNITDLIQKADYKAKVGELTKKVKDAQGRAVTFVDNTSRERVAAVAENLRKAAARLEQLSHREASAAPASPAPEVH